MPFKSDRRTAAPAFLRARSKKAPKHLRQKLDSALPNDLATSCLLAALASSEPPWVGLWLDPGENSRCHQEEIARESMSRIIARTDSRTSATYRFSISRYTQS
ncbi:MAG: hypothetical protein RLZZ326_2811 [Planctomycetota bacterium]